jgi:hypothetical protein
VLLVLLQAALLLLLLHPAALQSCSALAQRTPSNRQILFWVPP